MTLIEVVVAIGILAMVAVLIHGVIDSLSRGKKGEGERSGRVHEGREAMQRIVRDVSAAYISLHVPTNQALVTEKTAFVGRNSTQFDRLDFTAFAHRRTDRDSHESDQAEVGYFVVPDPDVPEKMDLVRREQTPIDIDPLKGGIVDVVAEDVDEFDVRYFDALTGQWVETWDTMQITGQPNRLPLEISVHIVLKGVGGGSPYSYTTKVFLPIQQPLSFGIPKQ
jgi:general secretion pathway protein J